MNNDGMFVLQDDYIQNKYNTSRVEFIQGHIKTIGRMANKIKNPIWKIQNENGDTFIIMYCEVDTLCILCPISYQKILDYEKVENDVKIISDLRFWWTNQMEWPKYESSSQETS